MLRGLLVLFFSFSFSTFLFYYFIIYYFIIYYFIIYYYSIFSCITLVVLKLSRELAHMKEIA